MKKICILSLILCVYFQCANCDDKKKLNANQKIITGNNDNLVPALVYKDCVKTQGDDFFDGSFFPDISFGKSNDDLKSDNTNFFMNDNIESNQFPTVSFDAFSQINNINFYGKSKNAHSEYNENWHADYANSKSEKKSKLKKNSKNNFKKNNANLSAIKNQIHQDYEPDEIELLHANDVSYTNENIILSGNIKIIYKNKTIKADYLNYIKAKRVIIISGNVALIDESNNVYKADTILLQNKFKEGVIKRLNIILQDHAKASADSATFNKEDVQFDNVYYTPCYECMIKDNLTWSLKSQKVTTDKDSVKYKNTILKFFGVPIFYMPYFEHPRSHIKRKSGFLMPKISFAPEIGFSLVVPYFFNISNSTDLVLKPIISDKFGPILWLELVHLFKRGIFAMDVSISGIGTFKTKKYKNEYIQSEVKEIKEDRFMGHLFTNLLFNIDKNWVLKSELNIVSNKFYLRAFPFLNFDNDFLKSYVSVENFNEKNYFNVTMLGAQSLQVLEDIHGFATLAPMIKYCVENEVLSGNLRTNFDFSFIKFYENLSQYKLIFDNVWSKNFIFPNGTVFDIDAGIACVGTFNNISKYMNSTFLTKRHHYLNNIDYKLNDELFHYVEKCSYKSHLQIKPRIKFELSHPLYVEFGEVNSCVVTPFVCILLVENDLLKDGKYGKKITNYEAIDGGAGGGAGAGGNINESGEKVAMSFQKLKSENFWGNLNRFLEINEYNFNKLNTVNNFSSGDSNSRLSFGIKFDFYHSFQRIFSYTGACINNIGNLNYDDIYDKNINELVCTQNDIANHHPICKEFNRISKLSENLNDHGAIFINSFNFFANKNLYFKCNTLYSSSKFNKKYNKFEFGVMYKNFMIESEFFVYYGNYDASNLFYKNTLNNIFIDRYHGFECNTACKISKNFKLRGVLNFGGYSSELHKGGVGFTYQNECMKCDLILMRKKKIMEFEYVNEMKFVVNLKTISY